MQSRRFILKSVVLGMVASAVRAQLVQDKIDPDPRALLNHQRPTRDDPLQVVAAAVTPVVMVSATAILISGVNARYMAISDRVRSLAHEFRDQASSEQRRETIQREIVIFHKRVHLVSWAIRALYVAVGCFITMTLLISATLWRQMLASATLPLFLLGLGFIAAAIVFQLLELAESNRTIHMEISDMERMRPKR